MSVRIHIDGSQVAEALQGLFADAVAPRSELFREVALDLIPMIHERIHVDGKKADGSDIGTYSNAYMKVRAKNKRGPATKKILSLTRQLENDYAVMPGEVGWGIGMHNAHNADKARWNDPLEQIYDLSESELDYAVKLTESLLPEHINQ